MKDITCLAEGIIYYADSSITGLNLNEIIVGGTGCGKSFSNAYSRLLHTHESSVVVPIAKRAIMGMFKGMFEERGYEVLVLDFAHPEKSDAGYDPLRYVKSNQDALRLARSLVYATPATVRVREEDPYWNNSATSVIAAEIILVRLIDEEPQFVDVIQNGMKLLPGMFLGKHPTFADVVHLHRSMEVKFENGQFCSNLDELFETAEEFVPGNQATQLWKTVKGLSMKTASCILSIANSAMDKIFTEGVLDMVNNKRNTGFRELGRRKTALFVLNSPMNKSLLSLANMMYSDLFKELFEEAEEKPDGRLDIPVHIVCDDFACTGRIDGFEDYISIFRAAGISVTLLLQSESQLTSMYGDHDHQQLRHICLPRGHGYLYLREYCQADEQTSGQGPLHPAGDSGGL